MLIQDVEKTVEGYGMLNNGDSVICAVSGGADSVCLLYVMLELRNKYNLTLYCANVNHKIRGEEANRDSLFVKELCEKEGIELFYREIDVPKLSKQRRIGEEECGRQVRYEFFYSISKKLGNAKIATAHNSGDNAETVLFRLARGTAGKGLCAIPPVRGNIIRPLLFVSRPEIEKYLKEKNITWVEDSTNKSEKYARNKIRASVIPVLEEINPEAQKKIALAASLTADDCAYLDNIAAVCEKKIFSEKGLDTTSFLKENIAIQRRIAQSVMKKSGVREITNVKINDFISLCTGDNGKTLDINKEHFFEKTGGYVAKAKRQPDMSYLNKLETDGIIVEKNWEIRAKIVDKPIKKRDNNIAVFDADKLSGPFFVRTRKTGDRMKILGMGKSKRLSDIFSNAKIPPSKRDGIPIIEKDGDILFLCGLRQSSDYAPQRGTHSFLIFEYITTKEW